jgi:hypothetical protein
MESRFNIPAPPTFNLQNVCVEKSEALIVLVPQGDVEATAKTDFLKHPPRKFAGYTKEPVP